MNKIIYTIITALLIASCGLPPAPDRKQEPAKATPAPEAKKPQLEILSKSETVDNLGMNMRTVHVELKNNSDKLCTMALLKAVYKDANGAIVGTGNGACNNLAAGATKTVDILAMGIENAKTFTVEIETELWE